MTKALPNIRYLRCFLAVAECKSISRATEKVFLSQPAITQAISKLEAIVKVVLFDRKSDGMYITELGQVYAERVERAMQMLFDGVHDAMKSAGNSSLTQARHRFNLMTTTQLRALIAVAAARNFSVASRNINISQSSLHRSARDLETLLGISLLEKVSTGISPTKSALYLCRAAKLAFSEITQGQDEIQISQNKEVGEIKIGSMPFARTSILPGSIIDFCNRYPDFKVTVTDGPYADLLTHLREGDLDLLVGALRNPTPSEDVVQEELITSPLVIVARREHPLLNVATLSLPLLSKASWVVPMKNTPTRAIFDSLFTNQGTDIPERLVETSSQEVLKYLLKESDRLTVISTHQITHELANGQFKILPFAVTHGARPIGITTRKSWRPTTNQQQIIELLRIKAAQFSETLQLPTQP